MLQGLGLQQDCEPVELSSGDVVDTQNCEGVLFLAIFGAADGTNKMVVQDGVESDGSDQAAVNDSKDRTAVAELTMNATATIGEVQVHKPGKRYVSVTLTGAATLVAVKYGHRNVPTDRDTTKVNNAGFISPYAA